MISFFRKRNITCDYIIPMCRIYWKCRVVDVSSLHYCILSIWRNKKNENYSNELRAVAKWKMCLNLSKLGQHSPPFVSTLITLKRIDLCIYVNGSKTAWSQWHTHKPRAIEFSVFVVLQPSHLKLRHPVAVVFNGVVFSFIECHVHHFHWHKSIYAARYAL